MGRYIDGANRTQSVLFPERLDDWIDEDNPVRAVDVFVDQLDLVRLGFERAQPAETGRPGYHPATLLKVYVYGYLNRIQSSRRATAISDFSLDTWALSTLMSLNWRSKTDTPTPVCGVAAVRPSGASRRTRYSAAKSAV